MQGRKELCFMYKVTTTVGKTVEVNTMSKT